MKSIKKPSIFIIRHAEKLSNPKIQDQNKIYLTKKGRKDSKNLGKQFLQFYSPISVIKTSSITRCIQTAQGIINGINIDLEIQKSSILGDPGAFVEDDRIASQTFSKNSSIEIVNNQLNGQYLPGLRNLKSGIDLFMSEVIEDLTNLTGNGIYVTHDVILATIIGYFTKIRFNHKNWVNFLEGLLVWQEDEGDVFINWRGEVYKILEGSDI